MKQPEEQIDIFEAARIVGVTPERMAEWADDKETAKLLAIIGELRAALEPFAYVGKNGLVASPPFSAYEHALEVMEKQP